jgi:uncharacterized protein YbjT (DUF2867 family)
VVHYIAYELNGIRLPDETARLEETIKALGSAYAFARNAWFVESELENREISAKIAPLLRQKDRLIVTRVYKDWVAANLSPEETEWLGSRNFTGITDPPTHAPIGRQR